MLLSAFIATSCANQESPTPVHKDDSPPSRAVPLEASPGLASKGASDAAEGEPELCPDDTAALGALSGAKLTDARLLSSRSLSLKLHLDNGSKAVFKPVLSSSRSALNEVAAYRLSRLLGVCEVPVATIRSLPVAQLTALIASRDSQAAQSFSGKAARDDTGQVNGALLAWVDDIDEGALGARGGRAWLNRLVNPTQGSEPSATDASLASQYARMLVFDHVIGNWDRFSGGNLFLNRQGSRLVLIDHNNSFAPWSLRQAARMKSQLEALTFFDPRQIERLRTLDAVAIRKAQGQDPLLGEDAVRLLLSRVKEVLEQVAKVSN